MPQINVSNGEVIDKITILILKFQHCKSVEQQTQALMELSSLIYGTDLHEWKPTDNSSYPGLAMVELMAINEQLWFVEQEIRRKDLSHKNKLELLDKVHKLNRVRSECKQNINNAFETEGSLKEIKDYETGVK